jgi:flagellar FliL protein
VAEEVDRLDEGEGAKASTTSNRKKKIMVIGAAAAVLLLGGGGGAYYMMQGGAEHGAAESSGHGETSGEEGKPVYVDVPPMVVNLRSADGQQRFL